MAKSLDVLECYAVHRRIASQWWPRYEDYVVAFMGLSRSQPYVLARNRFPYDVPKRQWVLWSLSGRFPCDVEAFVEAELRATPTETFENAPEDRSVPGLRHLHVRLG